MHFLCINPRVTHTLLTPSPGRSPLIVGDVKMSVDGEEGLLQEADPLPLLLLRLFKNGLHLLHVARRVGRHILEGFLVVLSVLQAAHKDRFYDEKVGIGFLRENI